MDSFILSTIFIMYLSIFANNFAQSKGVKKYRNQYNFL